MPREPEGWGLQRGALERLETGAVFEEPYQKRIPMPPRVPAITLRSAPEEPPPRRERETAYGRAMFNPAVT